VYLGLVETRYDYQLSYLDEWVRAWQRAASKFDTFNLIHDAHLKKLERKLNDFDLIVVLHSVSADSNAWLEKLTHLSGKKRAPMILFVGNEFSSPFLSTEVRLNLIEQISPEILASQLPSDCSNWLYEKTGIRVAHAPPGIPEKPFKNSDQVKNCDLGYRGFPYPWYLLDNERNMTVHSVSEYFNSRKMKIDISFTQRFNANEWFEFLRNSRFTVSSEAGSRFVFRDDNVWISVQEYFAKNLKFYAIENDRAGMQILRRLPSYLKKVLRSLGSSLGINQASLYKPDSREMQILTELIDVSKHEYRNGKCISSRHLDALACGTWQILQPGSYNDILKEKDHFSSWTGTENEELIELICDPTKTVSRTLNALESLLETNTYDARVRSLIAKLG